MKRFICTLLIMALCIGALSSPALALTATYSSTQNFIDRLDQENLRYSLRGITGSADEEEVTLSFSQNEFSYTIHYFFRKDEDFTSMYVWNLIHYSAADRYAVIALCNQLNRDFRFMKFYTDPDDSTVTAYMDMTYNSSDAGEVLYELLGYLRDILYLGYDQLKQYDTAA